MTTILAAICLWSALASAADEVAVMVSLDFEQIGFVAADFQKPQMPYTIRWRTMPRFPNLDAYHKLTNASCQTARDCRATVVSHVITLDDLETDTFTPAPFPLSSVVDPRHPVIEDLAAQILATHPVGARAAIKAILARVQGMVTYPDDLNTPVPNDGEFTTAFVLRSPTAKYIRGDCKTYANLFVALARRLGIPARIVSGYKLSAFGPAGHNWVEVKLGNQWHPVEPQDPTGIVGPGYLPNQIIGEESYQAGHHDSVASVTRALE